MYPTRRAVVYRIVPPLPTPPCFAERGPWPASPTCRSRSLSGRHELRPFDKLRTGSGTRSRWLSRPPPPAGDPSPDPRKLFKKGLRLGIALGMLEAHRNVTEAAGMQNTADGALTKSDAVLVRYDALQVRTAPCHDPIGLDVGTCLDDLIPRAETSDRSRSLILSRPRSGRVEGGASRLPRRGVETWGPSSFDTGLSGPAQDEGIQIKTFSAWYHATLSRTDTIIEQNQQARFDLVK